MVSLMGELEIIEVEIFLMMEISLFSEISTTKFSKNPFLLQKISNAFSGSDTPLVLRFDVTSVLRKHLILIG